MSLEFSMLSICVLTEEEGPSLAPTLCQASAGSSWGWKHLGSRPSPVGDGHPLLNTLKHPVGGLEHLDYSPPARWGLLDFIRVVLLLLLLLLFLLVLLHHLCLHFHVHFRLANPSPSSSPTSARNGHCWTSTARVWAHRAPLDLILGPSDLSEHGWTSTWDPPISVSTAGPQPGTLRAQIGRASCRERV